MSDLFEVPTSDATEGHNLAVLVIHGIGQQNPYETLDSFARGLFRHFNGFPGCAPYLQPERVLTEEGVRTIVHIGFRRPNPWNLRRVTLHELYWAPMTQDQVTYWESLRWLIRADLNPLSRLSTNLQEFASVAKDKSIGRLLGIFLREVARAALLFVPLALLLGWLFTWLSEPPSPQLLLEYAKQVLRSAPWWALGSVAVSLVMATWLLFYALTSSWTAWRRPDASIEKIAERAWILGAWLLGLAFVALCWLLFNSFPEIAAALGAIGSKRQVAAVLVALFGAAIAKRVLVDFMGDIAVYVTADEKSKNFAARSAILKMACRDLSRILTNAEYSKVILAGHSLGSVIAYDAINKTLSRSWRMADQMLQPIALHARS